MSSPLSPGQGSGSSKAFGRSLPREMQEDAAARRVAAGGEANPKPTQLWKVNDEKAGKSGPCQAVYWVKERAASTEVKRFGAKPEKQWATGAVYKGERDVGSRSAGAQRSARRDDRCGFGEKS